MSDEPRGRPLASSELVRRLWDDVRAAAEAPYISVVPDLGEAAPMVYDADLAQLNMTAAAESSEQSSHLLTVLNTMAERHDKLAAEIRLLRAAMKAEAERLAEHNFTLHSLLESR
ncbi:MAG: hypothetical protein M3256_20850, partial [Actinomycetota bacterium]|nr:hypothetical protein [Actinomycetota bacterium]